MPESGDGAHALDSDVGLPYSKTRRHEVIIRRCLIIATVILLIMLGGALSLAVLKTRMSVAPIFQASNVAVESPFVITLNQKLASIDTSKITTTPAVQGNWRLVRDSILGKDRLVFTPASYLHVNTAYTVRFPVAQRVFGGSVSLADVTYRTETAPPLEAAGSQNLKANAIIAADYQPSFSFTSSIKQIRDPELRSDRKINFVRSTNDNKHFVWKAKSPLPQGKSVKIELYDAKNETVLATKQVTVAEQPSITSAVKATNFTNKDTAKLVFKRAMVTTKNDAIAFSIDGEGKWTDDKTYEFSPKNVKPGETYTYEIKAGMRSKDGGILLKTLKKKFSTTGAVGVVSSSPSGTDLKQSSQQISFTFSRPVDHKSAEKHFQISSGTVTGFSWQANTMTASVKKLGYQHVVTASVEPGVKNTGFGLKSNRTYSAIFSTETRSKRLQVPYYHQQYAASCTGASLRMALAYRGIRADDMSIIKRMGYKPRSLDKKKNTWDDPALMFVGSVNGTIKDGTGAGPDAPPVAKAAQSYGRRAVAARGVSPVWIAKNIYDGNPVIMFGAFSNTGFKTWKTPSGKTARMNISGHATTVTGVVGEPSRPLGFWVNDPIIGAHYMTTGEVAANISRDAYRQAVVVY